MKDEHDNMTSEDGRALSLDALEKRLIPRSTLLKTSTRAAVEARFGRPDLAQPPPHDQARSPGQLYA